MIAQHAQIQMRPRAELALMQQKYVFYFFCETTKIAIKTKLRKGQCNVMEVLCFFNNKILGMDSMALEETLPLATGNNFYFVPQYC